jgi:hypothetical protein
MAGRLPPFFQLEDYDVKAEDVTEPRSRLRGDAGAVERATGKPVVETLIQTITGNVLPPEELRNETLTYVEWYRPGATLHAGDFERICTTPHLFARKFDATTDGRVLEMIDESILHQPRPIAVREAR